MALDNQEWTKLEDGLYIMGECYAVCREWEEPWDATARHTYSLKIAREWQDQDARETREDW